MGKLNCSLKEASGSSWSIRRANSALSMATPHCVDFSRKTLTGLLLGTCCSWTPFRSADCCKEESKKEVPWLLLCLGASKVLRYTGCHFNLRYKKEFARKRSSSDTVRLNWRPERGEREWSPDGHLSHFAGVPPHFMAMKMSQLMRLRQLSFACSQRKARGLPKVPLITVHVNGTFSL